MNLFFSQTIWQKIKYTLNCNPAFNSIIRIKIKLLYLIETVNWTNFILRPDIRLQVFVCSAAVCCLVWGWVKTDSGTVSGSRRNIPLRLTHGRQVSNSIEPQSSILICEGPPAQDFSQPGFLPSVYMPHSGTVVPLQLTHGRQVSWSIEAQSSILIWRVAPSQYFS